MTAAARIGDLPLQGCQKDGKSVEYSVPLDNPQPDAEQFMACMLGYTTPDRPPTIEYMVDAPVMQRVVTELLGRPWVPYQPDWGEAQTAYWDNVIAFWYRMGYDFVMMELPLAFPVRHLHAADTAAGARGDRAWADERQGMISSWEDFERYPWPSITDEALAPYRYVDAHLPDGMGLMASHAGGVLEHLSWIMSYEVLCLALHDAPLLVRAMSDRLGSLFEGYFARLLELDKLIALWPGDDMGFRTATLISPDHLREYVLPWHRRYCRMAHQRGVAYFLHTCGHVEAVMEDLIDDVGIDGRHSFEDTIIPAADFQQEYGDRVATLGGVDMHVLASADPADLRMYVSKLIEACAPGGRFAVGSGNSIANYVPLDNYLTMLDEARRY